MDMNVKSNDIAVSAITLGDENFNVTVPAAGGTANVANAPSAISSALSAVKVNIAADANASIKIGNIPFTQGQIVDFSAPVTFTVTAQDGTVKSYVINIPAYDATANPYGIYTVKHLVDVAKGLSASYLLKNNIDLPKADAAGAAATGISDYASAGWLPLGASLTSTFTGTFDGGNFSINNFYVNRTADRAGLFGAVGIRGAIKNLGVNGVITGTAAREGYAGILAGANSGAIDKCYATGSISATTASSRSRVGGLVGYNNRGSISNSYATGSVFAATTSSYAGGLAGHNYEGTIRNSYATGSVSVASAASSVGGLVGRNYRGSISNSYATGSVSSSSFRFSSVGVLAGYNDRGSISNSYAAGNVSASSIASAASSYAGGLAGWNNGSISNSYAMGSVSAYASAASSSSYAGGLAGWNDGSIGNSYATGSISAYASAASSSSYAGGLAGWNDGSIGNSYATGSISAYASYPSFCYCFSYAGGLVGNNNSSGSISNSYATGSVASSAVTTATSTTSSYVGGLAGRNHHGSISNSYATGSVASSFRFSSVGGLVGHNYRGSISNSYATGSVSAYVSYAYVGCLVGGNHQGTHTNCYRNSNAAITKNGQAAAIINDASITTIIAKSKAEMQTDAFKGNLNGTGTVWGRDDAKNDKLPYINGVGVGG